MIKKGLEIIIIKLIQLEQIPRVRTKSIVRLEEEDLEDFAEHKRSKNISQIHVGKYPHKDAPYECERYSINWNRLNISKLNKPSKKNFDVPVITFLTCSRGKYFQKKAHRDYIK